jgi:hypothetical protein
MAWLDLQEEILADFAETGMTWQRYERAADFLEGYRHRRAAYMREWSKTLQCRRTRRARYKEITELVNARRVAERLPDPPRCVVRSAGNCPRCGRELEIREGCKHPAMHRCNAKQRTAA